MREQQGVLPPAPVPAYRRMSRAVACAARARNTRGDRLPPGFSTLAASAIPAKQMGSNPRHIQIIRSLSFTAAGRFRGCFLESNSFHLSVTCPPRRRGASRASSQCGRRGLAPVFRDRLPIFGHEIARNIHDGLGRLNASLVLRQGLIFGLFPVMSKHPLCFVLIPSVWKLVLAHGRSLGPKGSLKAPQYC